MPVHPLPLFAAIRGRARGFLFNLGFRATVLLVGADCSVIRFFVELTEYREGNQDL